MDNIVIGLIGSLIVLDTTVAFQFLISQPLIACTLLGWFLGDIQLGLQIGMYVQLLWLSSMPVGASIVPEGNIAAVVITVLVFRYNDNYTNFNTILICAVLFGVFISYVGGELVVFLRKSNQYLLKQVQIYARKGKTNVLTSINVMAVLFHFTLMFGLIVASLIVGDFLFDYISRFPIAWEKYFKYSVVALVGIGAGLVVSIFKEKKYRLFLITGIVGGCILFMIK